VAKFEDRIKALAASHDLFVRGTWVQVELKDLIEAQLKPFSFEVRERLTLDGPLVFLSPAAAQTLGLVIHELATNSAKYGSLSTDAGSLAVTWTLETCVSDGMFRLRWVESGGPPVRTPERTGFGTRLIDGLTKRSLLAQVSAQYEISGFKWDLECPQSRLAIS
jgi:two-component sensor histidine kinase